MRSRVAAAVVLTLAALATVTGCGGRAPASQSPVADVSVSDDDGLHGILLDRPYHLPAVQLRTATGRPSVMATDTRKPLTLVFFGYTHCPDICQVVMANIASALVRLDGAQRRQVGMVFVTTDPARDTAAVLRPYLARFDRSFQGATGRLSSIVRLGKALGIPIERGRKLPSGGYDVVHGTQVIGVRPGGTAPFVWTQDTSPGALADDITKILENKVPRR